MIILVHCVMIKLYIYCSRADCKLCFNWSIKGFMRGQQARHNYYNIIIIKPVHYRRVHFTSLSLTAGFRWSHSHNYEHLQNKRTVIYICLVVKAFVIIQQWSRWELWVLFKGTWAEINRKEDAPLFQNKRDTVCVLFFRTNTSLPANYYTCDPIHYLQPPTQPTHWLSQKPLTLTSFESCESCVIKHIYNGLLLWFLLTWQSIDRDRSAIIKLKPSNIFSFLLHLYANIYELLVWAQSYRLLPFSTNITLSSYISRANRRTHTDSHLTSPTNLTADLRVTPVNSDSPLQQRLCQKRKVGQYGGGKQ